MIALTVSDTMDADMAVLRISDLLKRRKEYNVPDAICVRNDSFSEDPFISMTELVGTLWDGNIILESSEPSIISKAIVSIIDRRPVILGAETNNVEQFAMIASLFDCPLCVSSESLEELMDLSVRASSLGVRDVLLDPMMRNMKQCLEVGHDLSRLSKKMSAADHPIVVRTWSGEYAMTMAAVSLFVSDAVVVTDDLDEDICETLGMLQDSVR
jgi:CO dehydrogenase/acetyl-CoA synthase gamma subunit (corrinoid Fe-S protein)